MLTLKETFPPGEFLREELEARGLTPADLERFINTQVLNEIILGERTITQEIANQLAEALGVSAQFWINLERQWEFSRRTTPRPL